MLTFEVQKHGKDRDIDQQLRKKLAVGNRSWKPQTKPGRQIEQRQEPDSTRERKQRQRNFQTAMHERNSNDLTGNRDRSEQRELPQITPCEC